jgi:hypothetical protein
MRNVVFGAMVISTTLFLSGCNVTTSTSMTSAKDLPYNHFVVAAANENNISPNFVHQIIRVESRYRPNVTGKAGEIGLMQIKLQTARGMGYTGTRLGLYDPEPTFVMELDISEKRSEGRPVIGARQPCITIRGYMPRGSLLARKNIAIVSFLVDISTPSWYDTRMKRRFK